MNNPAHTLLFTLQKSQHLISSHVQKKRREQSVGDAGNKAIIISYLLVLTVSIAALTINSFYFHYIGNNYFPTQTIPAAFVLMLVLAGSYLQFNPEHAIVLIVRELFFFYLVILSLALITDAVQYTPFKLIDELIIHFESTYWLDMVQIIAWTAQYPFFKKVLLFAYTSLAYQLVLLPLFMIVTLNIKKIRSFYFFLLTSALIGFSIYYFFPTTAPASNVYSPFFFEEQRATGIKFYEIHNHLKPTTLAGGLIAFPSFHVIWAWFCLYLTYGYSGLFFLLLPLNCLLIASCVLLGWHYPLDLLGALLVILASHWLHHQFNNF